MEPEKQENTMHAYLLSAGAALGLLLTAVGTLLMLLVMIPVEIAGQIWDRLRGQDSVNATADVPDEMD